MFKRVTVSMLLMVAALALSGCNLLDALAGNPLSDNPTGEDADQGEAFSGTPVTLAPTLESFTNLGTPTPTVEGGLGPTPLPAPTQIDPGAAQEGEAAEGAAAGEDELAPVVPTPAPTGPGISLSPGVGEPGEIVMVDGGGFEPNTTVALHWGPPDGDTGPLYWEEETDDDGEFSVGLIVPPADRWPGGGAEEGELFQLRAFTEELGDFYYWANFKYVERFIPEVTLVLTFENPDYGYALDLPNAWTWSWIEDFTEDVRFASGDGTSRGFVRVIGTSNVNSAIQTVMAEEAAGQSYNTEQKQLGAYPGTEASAANGLVVWFIPQGGRVYAVSFTKSDGSFYTLIASTFRLG
jgi:hypothetical protein